MTSSDVEDIYSLLTQNNVSFEELFNNFQQKFPQENKRLLVCHTLGQLVKKLIIFPKVIIIINIINIYILYW